MKFWFVILMVFACAGVARADGLRPEIAKPLQLAEHDLSAHQYAAALRYVAKAEAIPGKSATETLTIAQVRAAIDASSGNLAAAAADYAAIIATGALPPDQLHVMAQAEASSQYQTGNYAGAITTIKTYLPGDPQFIPILLQSYEKLGQCDALNAAVMKLSRPPPETDLQLAAYCFGTAKDTNSYLGLIQTLVEYYPTPAYWTILLGQLQADPAYADRLALDFFRLKLAAGVPATEPDYMDMSQAALQAGLPNEAASIMAQGYAAGILGTGPDAARQTRLKALVAARQAAAGQAAAGEAAAASTAGTDQPTLFATGFNQVDGGNRAGLALMESAIRSGALTQPGQAELELGIAYREAAQPAKARAMWAAVQGGDGPAGLAALWTDLK